MSKNSKSTKPKYTPKEYMISIKMLIVRQVEQGELTVKEAKQRYGIQDESTILNWIVVYGSM